MLPDQDRDRIDMELASEDGLSPKMTSLIASSCNYLSSEKVKGAFGKRGTNRKQQIREKQKAFRKSQADAKKALIQEEHNKKVIENGGAILKVNESGTTTSD